VEDWNTDGQTMLKCILNMDECELDSTKDRGQMADPCDLDNELSGSTTAGHCITI
jgi:hypothetical protein